MMKNRNKLKVPPQFKHRIGPKARIEVFKEITAKYQSYFGIKCIYAFLNTDPKFMVDYGLIFKGKNDDKTHDIILYDIVPINSDRCTPEYPFYKNSGKEKNFFQYGIEEMVIMSPNRFYEYLEDLCGLYRDKNSDEYWKSPKNAKKLSECLLELALGYNRKKPEPDFDD